MSQDCLPNLHRCQAQCCRNVSFLINIPFHQLAPDTLNYWAAHAIDAQPHETGRTLVQVHAQCIFLTPDNRCSVHNTNRQPDICKRFGTVTTDGYHVPTNCIYANKANK